MGRVIGRYALWLINYYFLQLDVVAWQCIADMSKAKGGRVEPPKHQPLPAHDIDDDLLGELEEELYVPAGCCAGCVLIWLAWGLAARKMESA